MERGAEIHGRKNSWTDGESGASGSSRSTPVHGMVGISSAAGSSAGSGAASREETPGPMPKHRYSREELMILRDNDLSNKRPDCLSPDHDVEGAWDPEKWFRSFDSSRGSSPAALGGCSRERKRHSDPDKDLFKRKHSNDPKTRIKEEEEDGGIVLSPQRRSFGTGCHVTTSNSSGGNSASSGGGVSGGSHLTRRPGSPTDADRDGRERRGERRIGSGRLMINRDHHDRDFRDMRGRYERDRDRDRERDDFRSFNRGQDRFPSRRDSDLERRDFERDRGHRDRRFENRGGRYRRSESQEEEPEWFTGGPSSQNETIELHGFEGPRQQNEKREAGDEGKERRANRKLADGRGDGTKAADSTQSEAKTHFNKENDSIKEVSEDRETESDKIEITVEDTELADTASANVASDAAEVTEPAEAAAVVSAASPSNTAAEVPATPQQDFDFEQFFKNDNIPGLSFGDMNAPSMAFEQESAGGSSRFSQWFQMASTAAAAGVSHPSSHDNSRRSSINEEFSYLEDLVGSKSPLVPSPPMLPQRGEVPLIAPHLFTPITGATGVPHGQPASHPASSEMPLHLLQQQQQLMSMIQGMENPGVMSTPGQSDTALQRASPSPTGANIMEAKLKALLMGGARQSSSTPPVQQIVLPPGGKVMTASELEASLIRCKTPSPPAKTITPLMHGFLGQSKRKSPSPPQHMSPIVRSILGQGARSNQYQTPVLPSKTFPPPHVTPSNLSPASSVIPASGKVTTVSELEATMTDVPGLPPHLQHHQGALQMAGDPLTRELRGQMTSDYQRGHAPIPQQQQSAQRMDLSPTNMDAFNRLVGLMTTSGALPKMPKGANGRPLSPVSVTGISPQMTDQQQKELAMKALQQQVKLQQLQQQQQQLMKQSLQQPAAQAKQSPSQNKILPQQRQIQDQILKFMKQNPALVPPPAINPAAAVKSPVSPIPPQMTLHPNTSPRCPSPAVPTLLQQPPPSPRAPSPIMFGSQPPMHLTAPSPVHAAPMNQSLSPNSALQGSTMTHRVPSPQELIVHTQAIMQSALIKKQLEDQKERFLRRQQERGKSPNPAMQMSVQSSSPVNISTTSTPMTSTAKVVPAFMPTSVIRKMYNEKAEEEERAKVVSEAQNALSPQRNPPILRICPSDHGAETTELEVEQTNENSEEHTDSGFQGTPGSSDANKPPEEISLSIPMKASSHDESICVPSIEVDGRHIPVSVPAPDSVQPVSAIDVSHPPPNMMAQIKHPRPLFGQGRVAVASSEHNVSQTAPQPAVMPNQTPTPGRPITRQLTSQNSQETVISPPVGQRALTGVKPQEAIPQLSRPIVGSSSNSARPQLPADMSQARVQQTPTHAGIPITGRNTAAVPIVNQRPAVNVNPSPAAAAANAMLLQRMMHPGISPQTQRGLSVNQLAALQAARLTPAVSSSPSIPSTSLHRSPVYQPSLPASHSAKSAINMPLAGQTISPQHFTQPVPSQDLVNGQVSPSSLTPQMAALLGIRPAQTALPMTDPANLTKWFGSDVLKNQMPSMPQLPAQGQKVLTVDEIERR